MQAPDFVTSACIEGALKAASMKPHFSIHVQGGNMLMIKDALEANGLRVKDMNNGYLFVRVPKEKEHASWVEEHTMPALEHCPPSKNTAAQVRQMTLAAKSIRKAFDEMMEKIYEVAKCGNQMEIYVDHSPEHAAEQMRVCQKLEAIGFEIKITNTGFWISWE